MDETITGIRAILSHPRVYETWSRLVGAKLGRTILIRDHVRPWPEARVLDLGCGPGELFDYLGDVRYTGIDVNANYIAHARSRFGDRAEFYVNDAAATDAGASRFDLALSMGVLHHLDDDKARQLLRLAAHALAPTGRMVTMDGAFVPTQSRAARFVISCDRGRHVRTPDAYVELAASAFSDVTSVIREDLLRIPYTHCVLDCREPLHDAHGACAASDAARRSGVAKRVHGN
jgi:SAM-dependent methyltransferase